MDEVKKTLSKELTKDKFTHKDAERAYRIWTVVHNDEGGYVEDDLTIHTWADGDFTISENDGDGFISVHGETAKFALNLLRRLAERK